MPIEKMPERLCEKCKDERFYVRADGSRQCVGCHHRYCKIKRPAIRKAHRKRDPAVYLVAEARLRAKKAGIPFNLTRYDIHVPDRCPLLEIPLRVASQVGPAFNSPTLDRIVPSLGYVKGNVQVISHRANAMKNAADASELLLFSRNIRRYLERFS